MHVNNKITKTNLQSIISMVVENYVSGTILLQCGTNLFARGRLDCFNLSIDAAYSL